MSVTVAASAGFCFGVKRAVGLAYREAALAGAEGRNVYTMGPIIHNEAVVGGRRSPGERRTHH